MRWSKVRKLVEDSFADSVRGRVTVHSTKYRKAQLDHEYVHACVMVDRTRIATFSDEMVYEVLGTPDSYDFQESLNIDPTREKYHGMGLFGREFNHCCFTYAHSGVRASLNNPSPMIRALAMLNAKVGRQRLAKYADAETHPLPKALAEFRIKAEADARAAARSPALEPSP